MKKCVENLMVDLEKIEIVVVEVVNCDIVMVIDVLYEVMECEIEVKKYVVIN